MTLKGKAAIVGIGEQKPMRTREGVTEMHFLAETAWRAIDDAGLSREDIDGVIFEPTPTSSLLRGVSHLGLAEYLKVFPHYAASVGLAGASSAGMVWRAAAAIDAGLCKHVLCAVGTLNLMGGSTTRQPRSSSLGMQSVEGGQQFEAPYGPMGVNSGYALIAQRHAYEFGTSDKQRARIAVDQRTNACANPDATYYGKPINIEDVLNSRLVADPLHLLEIVMPCTGAAAVVVTSAEVAKSLRHPPVYLLGAGEYATHGLTHRPSLTTSPVKVAAARAFEMAGVSPKDINLVSVYDCYTIMVLVTLEDAGFCKKGEGGPFVETTDLTYKGKLPVNTHGGQLSFGQPGLAGGMSHITEAVRQLREQAGERQVADCELAYVNGNGGTMSEEVSLVLGRY